MPVISMADEGKAHKDTKLKNKATKLLPLGSELRGLMLPRYDENRKLEGVLKAETMKLISDDELEGTKVEIEFYNKDGTLRAKMDVKKAIFSQSNNTLTAREPIEVHSDKAIVKGNGLHYSFESGEGFIIGPATTIFTQPTKTAMNLKKSLHRTAALASTALILNQPIRADDEAEPAKANQEARENLVKDLDASVAALNAAKDLLSKADIAVPAAGDTFKPADKPHDMKEDASKTIINSKGGIYFDSKKGILVYLKDVTVKDPRFHLSGVNELKVFFDPPSPDKKPKPAEEKAELGEDLAGSIGKARRIVATGAVLLEQKEVKKGKEPIQASGAIFTYDIKEKKATISGGYPWVVQGPNGFRAKEPNLTLNISVEDRTFSAEPGNWETNLNVDNLKAP